MLETQGDDIYVVYDEMDLYAWHESSQAKLERFRITSFSIEIEPLLRPRVFLDT